MYRGKCTEANITKQFFPNVQDRLKMKINITTNFAKMVAGHSKTRAFFHHFKIMKQANVLATMEIKQ
jgi:hypothetical protein